MLGTDSDDAIAQRVGRSPMSVRLKRWSLGIASATEAGKARADIPEHIIARLGRESDYSLAREAGVAINTIRNRRVKRGISPYKRTTNDR